MLVPKSTECYRDVNLILCLVYQCGSVSELPKLSHAGPKSSKMIHSIHSMQLLPDREMKRDSQHVQLVWPERRPHAHIHTPVTIAGPFPIKTFFTYPLSAARTRERSGGAIRAVQTNSNKHYENDIASNPPQKKILSTSEQK